jgi:NAD(P)H dehydrogenase (quinone)
MSIVITGATGQLGRIVIADLLAAGVPAGEITAVARD